MTPLPKHLEEMRQSSAREYDAQEAEHLDKSEAIAYSKGFVEAAHPLLKDLESMAGALDYNQKQWEAVSPKNHKSLTVWQSNRDMLKNYRQKYEVKK